MPIGTGYEIGVNSYVAMFKETTYGTYPATAETGASTFEPISIGFRTDIVSQKLDAISRNRGETKRVQLDKNVSGTIDQYLHPEESILLFASALGGGITNASLTGGFSHTMKSGNFDTSPLSLSFLVRKGSQHFFKYSGGRTNVMTISGAVGDPIKVSYDFVFKDSTLSGADISTSLSLSSILPFTYVQGTYRYDSTEASLTSTVAQEITNFELSVNNNLISDTNVRALGSDVISSLPPTRRNVEFKITQRFDTTTAYASFLAATQGAVELLMRSTKIATTTCEHYYECDIILPKVYMNSPDPVITGANDILMSEIAFDVVVDNPSTTTGKDIQVVFKNATASY